MIKFYKFGNVGRNIIFLPGGGIDVRCYKKLLKELAKKDTVYAINFMESNSNSIDETIREVKKFIVNLNSKEIVLVGHSFGATIVNILSSELGLSGKVILINPTIFSIFKNNIEIVYRISIKTFIGWIRYPKLFNFYFMVNAFLFFDFIFHPFITYAHIKQSLTNIRRPIGLDKLNNNSKIILSKHDEFLPLRRVPEAYLKTAIIFDGNHDSIMNNTNFLTKIIQI